MKATVPEAIVEFLELVHKDGIEWQMKTSGSDRYAVVKKAASGSI